MSHFTRVRTRLVEKDLVKAALADLGYAFEDGAATAVRGFRGHHTTAEITVRTSSNYDIGFVRSAATDAYEVVADWWGVRGVNPEEFVQRVTQRYAYHAARRKLEEQGFTLAAEEHAKDGRIHLVLRRMA